MKALNGLKHANIGEKYPGYYCCRKGYFLPRDTPSYPQRSIGHMILAVFDDV